MSFNVGAGKLASDGEEAYSKKMRIYTIEISQCEFHSWPD
jgi:hypothetical protein